MDYEKKYKEALERARKLYDSSEYVCEMDSYATIFPELKESEDEMIRKEIIEHLRQDIELECTLSKEKGDKWISWLEKQGESYTKKDVDDAWLKGICDAKRELEKQCEQTDIDNKEYWRGYRVGKKEILDQYAELEKQGEQKPNPYSGVSFEYNGHSWGMCARDNGVDILLDKQLFKHLEKQDKQETLCDKCRKTQPSHFCQDIAELGRCALEKQS